MPVAPRLLTLTDHPGFDLVVIFIHMGDRTNGCYSPSGLVMEVPAFHAHAPQCQVHARRTTAVPQSGENHLATLEEAKTQRENHKPL